VLHVLGDPNADSPPDVFIERPNHRFGGLGTRLDEQKSCRGVVPGELDEGAEEDINPLALIVRGGRAHNPRLRRWGPLSLIEGGVDTEVEDFRLHREPFRNRSRGMPAEGDQGPGAAHSRRRYRPVKRTAMEVRASSYAGQPKPIRRYVPRLVEREQGGGIGEVVSFEDVDAACRQGSSRQRRERPPQLVELPAAKPE
jgi:hypothetical protein